MIRSGYQSELMRLAAKGDGFAGLVGDYGCYALCVIALAEKCGATSKSPLLDVYGGMCKGWIDKKDCTVLDPAAFLSCLTAQRWELATAGGTHKLPPSYKAGNGELVVYEWYNERTGYSHFTIEGFDGLDNSVTVKEGKIRSLRVFRRV